MEIKRGDFTLLAESYRNRPGYSRRVLDILRCYIQSGKNDFTVADVGAGTGKLTEDLAALNLKGYAVEPNDAMRSEGVSQLKQIKQFQWRAGSAEQTGLPDNSVDWVLMGSSFHWTKLDQALREFQRILRPGGCFTALWNPRDILRSELEQLVEKKILSLVPNLKRVSSGSSEFTIDLDEKLMKTGIFKKAFYLEAFDEVMMSPDRYKGAWQSVNDIQAQAGPENFRALLAYIDELIKDKSQIRMVYKTRAWTAECVK